MPESGLNPAPGPPTAPGAARPVTPLGLAAELIGSVSARLEAVDGVSDDVRADLRRAGELTGGLEAYVESCTSPPSSALAALAQRTAATDWRTRTEEAGTHLEQEMLSGHVEGRLLAMLVGLSGARRVLEVGMFTGYSALAMAEALPVDGLLVACELDLATADLARECLDASPAGRLVEVEVGPAADTLARLGADGEQFDLVFVDADKTGYQGYLDQLLGTEGGGAAAGLLAPGGLVCVDNTLLQGEPWAGRASGALASLNGHALASFNAALAADPRVEQVLLPVRDGLTLLRRV